MPVCQHPPQTTRMKFCSLLIVLLNLLIEVCLCQGNLVNKEFNVKVMNVTVGNHTLAYPDRVVILPAEYPAARRTLLLRLAGAEGVEDEGGAFSPELLKVLEAASLHYPLKPGIVETTTAPPQIYSLSKHVDETENVVRKRRSRLANTSLPLMRVKRYSTQTQGCSDCQNPLPQQPIVINIIKTDSDCGTNCYPQNSKPCGHPNCGYHPPPFHHPPHHPPGPPPHRHFWYPPPPPHPPPHFWYPPPPPPPPPQPPVYHSPPVQYSTPASTCDPCSRPSNTPPAPSPSHPTMPQRPSNNPQPSSPQPPRGGYSGGGFSQSSASASASASAQSSSFYWQRKK